jgi:hypothetical protein
MIFGPDYTLLLVILWLAFGGLAVVQSLVGILLCQISHKS